jgi:hypothetical protein
MILKSPMCGATDAEGQLQALQQELVVHLIKRC